ncbi:MAG: succinylglutamate desuccinylase, partial [Acidobacteria bacterium]|nr:succinylglutamate desuccinylase [Acidobacteriota bacterium]
WTESRADRAVVATLIPRYADVIRNGVGHYLLDPAKAGQGRVYYE